jgi:ABC-type transport system involved in multi-copper enzyme maturation permease subunit
MNSVLSELLKLKRNRLFLILFAGVAASPALTPILIGIGNDGQQSVNWTMYALQSQLPIYLCTFGFAVITATSIFANEFQLRTISTLFASTGSRVSVITAKLIALLIVLLVVIITTGLVNIAIGAIVASDRIDGQMLSRYVRTLLWSIPSYFALVPMATLLGVLLKKAALASIIYLAFAIMAFPFSEQAVFIPPLLPMHLAMRLLSRGLEIPAVAFLNSTLSIQGTAVSLSLFFGIPLIIQLYYVRRMDVCG